MTGLNEETGEISGPLAGIHFHRDDDAINGVLDRVAADLQRHDVRVCGLLPKYAPDPLSPHPVMYVENIPDRRRFRISQRLGPEATGCRLDAGGLVEAAAIVEASLQPDTALLILNRFGRAEAEGGGLRSVIERALAMDIPVLVAVRETYVADWQAFHGGIAETLSLDADAVLRWCLKAVNRSVGGTVGA